MEVSGLESTPNPHSFMLRLDKCWENLPGVSGLRGRTFRPGTAADAELPADLGAVLSVPGVDSLYAMEAVLTVNKFPRDEWATVLPPILTALGGASESLLQSDQLLRLMLAPGANDSAGNLAAGAASGVVKIRLQASQGLPIQVEAVGAGGLAPAQRARLSVRFGDAMALVVGSSPDAFFAGRSWLDRGVRYQEEEEAGVGTTGEERERRAVAAVLAAEVADIEAAYPPDRIAGIVAGARSDSSVEKATGAASSDAASGKVASPADVEAWCEEDALAAAGGGAGSPAALAALAAVARSAGAGSGAPAPSPAARRVAIAYLGGTGGRGGDGAFDAVGRAFRGELAPGLRRTAGDALSDLGDARAVPLARAALADPSKLVRWRAARILGELGAVDGAEGDSGALVAALREWERAEGAFEVAFEMADAARRVEARAAPGEGGPGGPARGAGPVWKQIQEGSASQEKP